MYDSDNTVEKEKLMLDGVMISTNFQRKRREKVGGGEEMPLRLPRREDAGGVLVGGGRIGGSRVRVRVGGGKVGGGWSTEEYPNTHNLTKRKKRGERGERREKNERRPTKIKKMSAYL